MRRLSIVSLLCLICSCAQTPENISTVNEVDARQYLGTWYEIARLDHSFESGLEQVTANYASNADGSIEVINRGFNAEKQKWEEANGKAYFVEPASQTGKYSGKLKVSFFGPFYSAYNIIALDKVYYQYAMVCGPNKSYLWILSRTPQLTYPIKQELIAEAKLLGFDTNALIFVNQVSDSREFKAGPHINPAKN